LSEKKPVPDAACVIRYLRYNGKSDEEITKVLTRMLRKIYYTPSRPDMMPYIKPAFQMADKLPPIRTDNLYISKEQLDIIASIGNPEYEDFVFAALCIQEYYTNDRDKYIVKFKDALNVAGISSYKKVIDFLRNTDLVTLRQFRNVHFLDLSERLFPEENSKNSGIVLDNFLDLCYYYDEYRGYGKFTRCEYCGRIVKQPRSSYQNNGRHRKYCKTCWKRVKEIKSHSSRYTE